MSAAGPDGPASRPWLSVVMPVHNGEQWIEATLTSLSEEIEAGIEVLVLDSSPDGGTLQIVKAFEGPLALRTVHCPNVPAWPTKTNMGVEQALAAHVCILHQDDLWLPGRAQAVRRWISEAPDAALHLAPTAIVDRDGRSLGLWRCPLTEGPDILQEAVVERLLVQNFVSVPSPVFRRDAWIACGGMDPSLWYTCDWDIWLKLSAAGPVRYHEEVTTGFRVHGTSLTVTGSRNARDFEAQMQAVLDRHLQRLPEGRKALVERVGRASIRMNVALAVASRGEMRPLPAALASLLALGPRGILRYFRHSRIVERVAPRLRARLAKAF